MVQEVLGHSSVTIDVQSSFELDYFDQAHLTNSLKRFIGETPSQIAQKSAVG